MSKLSARQREALALVGEGRVEYGAEHQNMARRGRVTWPVFLIDGHAAYGQQGRTFASREERGLIVVRHDLVEHKRVPAQVKTYSTISGATHTRVLPAHDAPVDPGWRARVEVVQPNSEPPEIAAESTTSS
ncbi:hypothetical protein [Mycobacterium hubeiense]|uniref:hypothetical protein n=1 Tax=Mycobacterium hubeiense TaxID=1867256 RepID=UPI000C7F5C48|nr:hypothetical protein [Mycobacterium sp. QGD 101]